MPLKDSIFPLIFLSSLFLPLDIFFFFLFFFVTMINDRNIFALFPSRRTYFSGISLHFSKSLPIDFFYFCHSVLHKHQKVSIEKGPTAIDVNPSLLLCSWHNNIAVHKLISIFCCLLNCRFANAHCCWKGICVPLNKVA